MPQDLRFVEAPSDLIPGVYEGGLKTWECSVDLAGHVQDIIGSHPSDYIKDKRILEVSAYVSQWMCHSAHVLYGSSDVAPRFLA